MPNIEDFKKASNRFKRPNIQSKKDSEPTQSSKNIFNVLEELTAPYHKDFSNKSIQQLSAPTEEIKKVSQKDTPSRHNNATLEKLDQTQNKHRANIGQSSDKHRTNAEQTQDKVQTNIGQSSDKHRATIGQIQDKVETKPRTSSLKKVNIMASQSSFFSLVGLQRSIVLYLFNLCKTSCSKHTGAIPVGLITTNCKTTKFSVQKSLQRLEKKEIIIRAEFKNGRGGWTKYELPDQIFQEILTLELQNINYPIQAQSSDKVETKLRTINDHSSSSIYNKTTTTEREEINANDFTINISPLSSIGLTHGHIAQLTKQQKLTFEQIQDSIHYFAFDLARNEKAKTLRKDALNFFMGILRQGLPYAPPNNYESPEAEAMRLHLESKAKAKKINEQLEKEFKESLWLEWREALSEQELMEFYIPGEPLDSLSEKVRAALKRRNATSSAYQYFESEIWPLKLKEIVLAKSSVLIESN
jgi:hypothetical protein